MTWKPILTGAQAEQATEAIHAIADCLADSFPPEPEDPHAASAARVSLESGRPGLALFYAYLDRAGLGGGEAAARLLGGGLERLGAVDMGVSLCSGLAGVGWGAAHLARLGVLAGPDPAAIHRHVETRVRAEIDRLATSDGAVNYDLLFGVVGLGVYALERPPEPDGVALLERVVARLDARAERQTVGITWWTPPTLTYDQDAFPNGWYNLGAAHGVPGVIALLGLACRAGVATDRARLLLDGAVSWMLARRLPTAARSVFPAWVGTGVEARPSRLAWCYGDLGLAAALLVAARAVSELSWERAAIEVALHAARRSADQSGVVDAPICHGAIGVGHVFNRIYQATGERALGEAARFWLERGLAMRRPGGKLGGFYSVTAGSDATIARRVAYRGILNGAAGIGLALLAATTEVEPEWDRLLLLS
jgi:lantibiotic biosynthesis protein